MPALTRLAPRLGLMIAIVTTGSAAVADDTPPDLRDCIAAVGTYLTEDHTDGTPPDEISHRSLLSLTNGGHFFLTDSAQGGATTYQPFTSGRGAWNCVSGDQNTVSITAVVLDFTLADEARPNQQIARLDYRLTFNGDGSVVEGKVDLGFVPLDGDPLDQANLTNRSSYTLRGQKVIAP